MYLVSHDAQRSHSPSGTGRDSGGQGETICRFYQVLALLEGQGETPNCDQIAVKNLGFSNRTLEPEARLPRINLLGSLVNRGLAPVLLKRSKGLSSPALVPLVGLSDRRNTRGRTC